MALARKYPVGGLANFYYNKLRSFPTLRRFI